VRPPPRAAGNITVATIRLGQHFLLFSSSAYTLGYITLLDGFRKIRAVGMGYRPLSRNLAMSFCFCKNLLRFRP